MKLQQLRYIVEVVNNNLNVSTTAERLYTSQPGISKQIKLLEDELGVQIFSRTGKNLTSLTPIGEQIITVARDILSKANAIKVMTAEFNQPNHGALNIATTYTQARYALPRVIQQFMAKYANIALHMEQGSSKQIIDNVLNGDVDFAIVTELPPENDNIVVLPCYHWNYSIVVTKDHPLATNRVISIDELAQYPLVSYDFSKDGSDLNHAFLKAGKEPNIAFSTTDADLIKTYVRLGVGVGIVATMAINTTEDSDLVVLNAGHLFSYNTTYVVFMKRLFLRNYMYDFINQFSSHLTKELINNAIACDSNMEILTMFNGIKLPVN